MSRKSCWANTFLNMFLPAKGQYPAQNFRTPDWIHSTENMWWSRMVDFMLSTYGDILRNFGLYRAIEKVQFGLLHKAYHLFTVLKMYNPFFGTFITSMEE